ncbi:MYG1 family protein [Sinorhizobium meliloti]|nr:MYG1 family protein [Sinorhizobium meliloti]
MTRAIQRLITHSGSFHADDVMATVVLRRLHPQAALVRTRDRAILDSTTDTDIVYDVGFEYDPSKRRYDHHQPGHPLRDDDTPYSSFGLIWLHHGAEFLRSHFPDDPEDVLRTVWRNIDRKFVIDIDRSDNGYVPPGAVASPSETTLSLLVEDFVAPWDDASQDNDARFLEAVSLFGEVFRNRVIRTVSMARAEAAVLDAFRNAEDPRIVVIPDYMPVGSVVRKHGFDEALYTVERSRSGEWFVTCVRPEGDPFGQRKPLPLEWAGLRDAELAAITGVEDAVFCHVKRFTCATRSLDTALQLARLAVDWEPAPSAVLTSQP